MAAPQLTRTHRILIGVVVAGAVVIAGIGFAGSYAAVRSLALQKGFGNFSYVFPIGIDAGICVLLALDLLLTWIRIPFPLLRQTAWLLTAATIAFNGAAAWPDPLGVGMHAVIPILFVVSVEAARHAVGRIADIMADKHMEGVRLTRWLLSPLPTFLLWRRMKLWELRSYEAVIKLEQDRLVYQARLHSRFGRAWRRKAPVESLMPLRLARYGVPLAETAPSGLAAAGIEPALLPAAPQQTAAEQELPIEAVEVPTAESSSPWFAKQLPAHQGETAHLIDYFSAYEDFLDEYQVAPTVAQFAHYLRVEHEAVQDDGSPLSEEELLPLLAEYAARSEASVGRQDMGGREGALAEVPVSEETWAAFCRDVARAYVEEFGNSPDSAALAQYLRERYNLDAPEPHLLPAEVATEHLSAPSAAELNPAAELARGKTPSDEVPVPSQRDRAQIDVTLDTSAADDDGGNEEELPRLTNPDRYYLAYQHYVDTHGTDPKGRAAWEEVAQQVAASGVLGDKGQPVSPSTLRRYALEQRIYRRWADEYERLGEPPTYEALLDRLAHDGVKSGNRQLTLDDLQRGEHLASGFERRYDALHNHN
ncbi:DUF2637 domain-containing protein [Streptomyces sp. NBC_00569]|uniref:DUF2637 domain-containing protein n=1 Tax=Streptomyces sp. NBC_00569 TaxID=2975780 RepID=UPI002E816373|nr:DUF2637 domain-containing protein [Streptomyces sp. NBC_00569]WUB92550.1 DUF2637 domain-containing protein [Streptomyces sp. NBC_00569]